jgi:hypothetical protein
MKTIKATDISAGGKKTWSQNMEDAIYKDIWGGGSPSAK